MNNRLREFRKDKGMSQWKLAKEAGVVQSKISLFENDLYKFNSRETKSIADVLGIPVEKIFSHKDIKDEN